MNIRRNRFRELWPAFETLCHDHWREIARWQDEIPLTPDWPKYDRMDAEGSLLCLGVWDGEELAGYSLFCTHRPLHYCTQLYAFNDIVYLKPEHRHTGVGGELLRESEALCRAAGARVISWHVKPEFNFGPALEAMGYILGELAYIKLLY